MKTIKQGDKLSKIFRGTVKSFDEKTHTAVIDISTKSTDRDGEVIEPASFQKRLGNYLAHPVLLSSHRTETLTRQIGEAKDIKITETGVEGVYEWYAGKGNPEADWGWFLVTRGIAAFSVGFIPFEWIDNNSEDRAKGIFRRFTDIELLENSQVLVPANAQALQRRAIEAQGEEKELCEMVVKGVKAEEMAQFDTNEKDSFLSDPRLVDLIKQIATKSVLSEVENTISKIKEDITKSLSLPKHYSEILLEPGRNVGIQSSTEAKNKVKADSPEIDMGAITAAVKTSVKESIK